jgi:hypothetical protein
VEAGTAGRRDWTGWLPLSGVVAVALWILGVVVLESVSPDDEESAADILAYFDDESTTLLFGVFFFALGTVFFVWFLGSLRTAFLSAEGVPGTATAIAFVGGIGKAVFDLAVVGNTAAGALAAEEGLTPEAAQAIFWMDNAFFVGAQMLALVFMAASALVVLRTRALPAWMGWLAALVGLGLLIFPIGWLFLLFGLPLWVLLASVLLFLRAGEQPAGAPAAPPTV